MWLWYNRFSYHWWFEEEGVTVPFSKDIHAYGYGDMPSEEIWNATP
jgi:hypothetical protein